MTHMLLAVSAVALMTGVAFAENETSGIDQGIASKQLNEREADRLNTQQREINKMEEKAKSDGVMTRKERARIAAAQDRAARHIAREKHDRKGKRHR